MTINEIMRRNLARLREETGLSQKKIADIVGVAQPVIYRLESGLQRIPTEYIDVLCDYFDLHPSYFFATDSSDQSIFNIDDLINNLPLSFQVAVNKVSELSQQEIDCITNFIYFMISQHKNLNDGSHAWTQLVESKKQRS